MTNSRASVFLSLPTEIIHQILSYLPPLTLVDLSATCLLLHSHVANDLLWAQFVQENLPVIQTQPLPYKTWKELYVTHYPYWFLPKHKIWYSDKAHTGSEYVGQVVLARYDYRTGCIEAYRIVAEHGSHEFESWEQDPGVIIHTFNPKVSLFLDDPVVKLNRKSFPPGGRLQHEVAMHRDPGRGFNEIRSRLFLTRPIASELQDPCMALWPPRILPALQRVRNDSPNMFRNDGHRPQNSSEISDAAFRIRKWLDFRGIGDRLGVKMGEDVMTFSTLPSQYYEPNPGKPYQGLWVGDYSGYGCEFVVIIQRDAEEARHIPPIHPNMSTESSTEFSIGISQGQSMENTTEEEQIGHTGRLEAIKLTGDPNVPRGQYTWVAEDISRCGLVRVADEQMFKGARVVKSWGHIAGRGFRHGIPFLDSLLW